MIPGLRDVPEAGASFSLRMPTILAINPFPPPVMGLAVAASELMDSLEKSGLVVERVPTSVSVHGWRGHVLRLVRHVKGALAIFSSRRRVSCIYTCVNAGKGIWYTTLLALTGRCARRPLILHHHSSSYVLKTRLTIRILERVAGPRSTSVLLCEAHASEYRRRYPSATKVRAIPVVYAVQRYLVHEPAAHSTNGSRPVVLGHLSNLTLEKGLGVVIATVRALVDQGLDVELWLGGLPADDASAQQLREAKHVLGKRLRHLGALDGEEKLRFYDALDLFLFPSSYEHECSPLVVWEAIARDVTTVAFQIGCLQPPSPVPALHLVGSTAQFVDVVAALAKASADNRRGSDAEEESRRWLASEAADAADRWRRLVIETSRCQLRVTGT